jgi:hypothetical protein
LVDKLPELGRPSDAVIRRKVNGNRSRDLILLPKGTATAELLDAATRALLTARRTQGAAPNSFRGKKIKTVDLGVRNSRASAAWGSAHQKGAEGVLSALLRAPEKEVPGLGRVQAIEFWPPRLSKKDLR